MPITRCRIRYWETLLRGAGVPISTSGSRSGFSPTVARGTARFCGRFRRSPMRKFAFASARRASSIRKESGCVAEHDSLPWTRPGHFGAASSGVVIAEATIAAAWNVQGNAEVAAFADAVHREFDVALPVAPNTIAKSDTLTAVWLGP